MRTIARFCLSSAIAFLAFALLPAPAPAQGRGGMHGGGGSRFDGVPRGNFGIRGTRRADGGRAFRRNFFNDGFFLYPPYLFPEDEFDYGPPEPGPGASGFAPAPAQMAAAPPATLPSPPPPPAEPLLLEIRDGQWVRVPTGSQLPIQPATKSDAAPTSAPAHPGIAEPAEVTPPAPPLPPATLVFRDGHTESVAKYMIQGHDLYTSEDYWTTGTWTRKIPLADLDIPASMKLNQERGTKFSLPSAPNEIVIRF